MANRVEVRQGEQGRQSAAVQHTETAGKHSQSSLASVVEVCRCREDCLFRMIETGNAAIVDRFQCVDYSRCTSTVVYQFQRKLETSQYASFALLITFGANTRTEHLGRNAGAFPVLDRSRLGGYPWS